LLRLDTTWLASPQVVGDWSSEEFGVSIATPVEDLTVLNKVLRPVVRQPANHFRVSDLN
jgi:hypothetical protein